MVVGGPPVGGGVGPGVVCRHRPGVAGEVDGVGAEALHGVAGILHQVLGAQ